MTFSRHLGRFKILPESWDESKRNFKGEVDGFKIGEGRGGEGRGRKNTPFSSLSSPPLPLSLFRCFSRSRVFVKRRLLCRPSVHRVKEEEFRSSDRRIVSPRQRDITGHAEPTGGDGLIIAWSRNRECFVYVTCDVNAEVLRETGTVMNDIKCGCGQAQDAVPYFRSSLKISAVNNLYPLPPRLLRK